MIQDLQTVISKDNNKIVAADVLVKEATVIYVDMVFTIQVTSGYNHTTVSNAVSTNISTYLSGLAIGDDVIQSSLVVVIVNTTGVDNVNTPFTTLESSDALYTRNSNYDLIIPDGKYVSAGTISITTT